MTTVRMYCTNPIPLSRPVNWSTIMSTLDVLTVDTRIIKRNGKQEIADRFTLKKITTAQYNWLNNRPNVVMKKHVFSTNPKLTHPVVYLFDEP